MARTSAGAGATAGRRLSRRKLGLAVDGPGKWHGIIETEDLAHLEGAFALAGARAEPADGLHLTVNHTARNARFALYRDVPDGFRHEGEERF